MQRLFVPRGGEQLYLGVDMDSKEITAFAVMKVENLLNQVYILKRDCEATRQNFELLRAQLNEMKVY